MRAMMRATALLTVLVAMGVVVGGQTPEAWTTDWSAFVQQLSVAVSKDASFVSNVNEAFSGKMVTWEGTVAEIKRPAKPGESGLVRVSMKPERLTMTGTPTLDSLALTPEDADWETWKSVSVGDTVSFGTTLDEGSFLPRCVLTYLVGVGPNAGKTAAWINTKGAKCLHVGGGARK